MGHAIACVQHFQPDHLIIIPALSKRDLEACLGRASRIEAGILRDRLDGVPGQFKLKVRARAGFTAGPGTKENDAVPAKFFP